VKRAPWESGDEDEGADALPDGDDEEAEEAQMAQVMALSRIEVDEDAAVAEALRQSLEGGGNSGTAAQQEQQQSCPPGTAQVTLNGNTASVVVESTTTPAGGNVSAAQVGRFWLSPEGV
jgi:hypothetical protein